MAPLTFFRIIVSTVHSNILFMTQVCDYFWYIKLPHNKILQGVQYTHTVLQAPGSNLQCIIKVIKQLAISLTINRGLDGIELSPGQWIGIICVGSPRHPVTIHRGHLIPTDDSKGFRGDHFDMC